MKDTYRTIIALDADDKDFLVSCVDSPRGLERKKAFLADELSENLISKNGNVVE